MTRARVFSKGLGGAGGANANITLADITPYLTTANVREIFPNVYYSNARVFANINLASLDDLFDVGNTSGKLQVRDLYGTEMFGYTATFLQI